MSNNLIEVNEDHVVSVEEVKQVLKNSEAKTSLVIQKIGDLARQEGNRDALREGGACDFIIEKVVNSNDDEESALAMRAMANLIYEHETNRALFTKESVVKKIVELLDSENSQILKNTAGATANLAYQNETAMKMMMEQGALSRCHHLLTSNQEDVILQTLLAIENLLEDESQRETVGSMVGEEVLQLLNEKHDEDLKCGILSLMAQLCSIGSVRIKLIQKDLLKTLFKLVHEIDQDFDVNNDNPEQESSALMAFLLIQQLAEHFDNIRAMVYSQGYLDTIRKYLDEPPNNPNPMGQQKLRRVAGRVLASCTADDDTMQHVYTHNLNWLLGLCRDKDQDVCTSALMALSNLARTETNCIELVKNHTLDMVTELLDEYSNDQRLQLHCGSLLRNLAIPAANKPVLLAKGYLEQAFKLLQVKNRPIQFNAVEFIKILVSSQECAQEFIKLEGHKKMVDVCKGVYDPTQETEDEEKKESVDNRVHYEAARVLFRLLNPERKDQCQALTNIGVASCFTKLLETPHPLLHIEGCTGLANLIGVTQAVDEVMSVLDEKGSALLANVLTIYINKENMLPQERHTFNQARIAAATLIHNLVAAGAKDKLRDQKQITDALHKLINAKLAENVPLELKKIATQVYFAIIKNE